MSSEWMEKGGLMVGSEWGALRGGWLKKQVDAGRGNRFALEICNGRLQQAEPTMWSCTARRREGLT